MFVIVDQYYLNWAVLDGERMRCRVVLYRNQITVNEEAVVWSGIRVSEVPI